MYDILPPTSCRASSQNIQKAMRGNIMRQRVILCVIRMDPCQWGAKSPHWLSYHLP